MNQLPALRIADIQRELHDFAEKTGNAPRLDFAKIAILDARYWVSNHEETIKLHCLLNVVLDVLEKIEKDRLQHVDDLKMELYYLLEDAPHLKP